MSGLRQSGAFEIQPEALKAIRKEFKAGRATQEQVAQTIKVKLADTGYLLDPHTATGVFVAEKHASRRAPWWFSPLRTGQVSLCCRIACGIFPALPSWLNDLMTREEHYDVLDAELKAVESFVSSHARAKS